MILKVYFTLIFLLSNLILVFGQSPNDNKNFLSNKEITYLYNKLLDEVIHNDNLARFDMCDFYKYYNKSQIIVELNVNTQNHFLKYTNETKDLSVYNKISMNKRLKKIDFITSIKLEKVNWHGYKKMFSKGVKYVQFSDIYYTNTGDFFIGVGIDELVPGGNSKEVTAGNTFVLKGVKCTSGQLIVNKILFQNNGELTLSNESCLGYKF